MSEEEIRTGAGGGGGAAGDGTIRVMVREPREYPSPMPIAWEGRRVTVSLMGGGVLSGLTLEHADACGILLNRPEVGTLTSEEGYYPWAAIRRIVPEE